MVRKFNTDSSFADYPAVISGAYMESASRFGCVAGSVRLYISASGDVQPCPLVNLSLGNVRDDSLAVICERMRLLLPCPSSDLLCCQLQPAVSDYMAKHGGDCNALPVPVGESTKILEELGAGETPEVWAL